MRFRPRKKNTGVATFKVPKFPGLKPFYASHRDLTLEKGAIFLQNDALIAILIVRGRESMIWKARDELCRVVGSEKTRNRKNTRKK